MVGRVMVLVVLVAAGVSRADDSLILRARGFVRGKAEITEDRIRCEVPGAGDAIPDATFVIGLFDTFDVPTVSFPDQQNPFADPCGGWLHVESVLQAEGVQLERVSLRYRLGDVRRLRRSVPLRQGFPVACQGLRRAALDVGARLDPARAPVEQPVATGFVSVLPMASPELLRCLQAALEPAVTVASVPLLIRARAIGVNDGGSRLTSNAAGYTLTLVTGSTPLPMPPPSG